MVEDDGRRPSMGEDTASWAHVRASLDNICLRPGGAAWHENEHTHTDTNARASSPPWARGGEWRGGRIRLPTGVLLMLAAAWHGCGRRALAVRLHWRDILDVGKLHVRVAEAEQAGLGCVYGDDLVRLEDGGGPDVEHQVALVEQRIAKHECNGRPLGRLLGHVLGDGVRQLGDLG
eukprot:scaffold2190_cov118-Isochrysis_galbana.AAC.5